MTNREYAYFQVTGPGTHEQVTEILGFPPSEAWNVGDLNPRDEKPRKFMSWRLASGLDDTEPLERHIDTLFLYLQTRSEQLRTLWVEFDLTLQCVGYYPASGHGTHFNRERIRQAAQLGIAIDLDFYYIDDHGHDL